jgi:hypothetical protein
MFSVELGPFTVHFLVDFLSSVFPLFLASELLVLLYFFALEGGFWTSFGPYFYLPEVRVLGGLGRVSRGGLGRVSRRLGLACLRYCSSCGRCVSWPYL